MGLPKGYWQDRIAAERADERSKVREKLRVTAFTSILGAVSGSLVQINLTVTADFFAGLLLGALAGLGTGMWFSLKVLKD